MLKREKDLNKLKIYIDTSIIGGCFDEEFQLYSNFLFKQFIEGDLIAVISELTLDELENGPPYLKEQLNKIPDKNKLFFSITEEAIDLARKYIENDILTDKMFADALHIAIATIVKVDAVVSWNFKHIVNLKRIKSFNAVNLKEGYYLLEIRSPREIIDEKF